MNHLLCVVWTVGTGLLLAQAGEPASKFGAKPNSVPI
jgi:hypothetical protein